ncbi:glycoside hydrolase family 29 protein [Roridomyces roridus]|uniref:alpha-L-fucosidase n=1 Tax=Roridomyces roridus TaxID=1738132 RepID=A0AAD7C2A6_9AGAR|nr:glycoside hydrolase family 29 protein [Roridomyces roridus]
MHLRFLLLLFSGLWAQFLTGQAAYSSEPISLDALKNNKAAWPAANFDGLAGAYDSQFLPTGTWEYDGLTFSLPASWEDNEKADNVLAAGQVLDLDTPTFAHELQFLYAGDGTGSPVLSIFTLTFADGSSYEVPLEAKNWWVWANINRAAISTPYHFEAQGKNLNATNIFQWSTAVPSESPLVSIAFPSAQTSNRIHVFALSFTPSMPAGTGLALAVRRARFTTRWDDSLGARAQAIEVTLANLLPSHTLGKNTSLLGRHTVEVVGNGLQTVSPGVINRLVPADQARVDVLVTGASSTATVNVRDAAGNVVLTSGGWATSPLVEQYTADAESLSMHEAPAWFNGAKYGIFVHWGVYSYPAWAPKNEYAEWYDYYLHNPPDASNPTWEHHLQTYGPHVVYDDFIPKFTASQFNASAWVDLFDRAGAKYFVLVTKHHDGFALFDTGNTTNRNSLLLGPKRDLVAELLQTAKKEKPDLHRGTYYSLPEWFNPDFQKYGFGSWPGGLAHNAFNVSPLIEPYTGHVDIGDYIQDLQLPQMVDLAVKYDTEIMWCDIGGPHNALEFSAAFYNHAMAQGRQVTINDRCGLLPDWDTPEYATFGSIQTQKWESSEGMDPFSYGLNSATNASEYKNGTTIIQTLVDIVSKNGNFLLDIGPTAEGTIIEPEMNNLLDAGSWLKYAGGCVYDTEYWFSGSQDPNPEQDTLPARFTTTPTTFCIVAFSQPVGGKVTINKRLPILDGDSIVLLRPQGPSAPLTWNVDATKLVIDVAESEVAQVEFAWAFQVNYANVN